MLFTTVTAIVRFTDPKMKINVSQLYFLLLHVLFIRPVWGRGHAVPLWPLEVASVCVCIPDDLGQDHAPLHCDKQ